MTCEQAQELIHAYIDGELDLLRNVEMESHLAECENCHTDERDNSNLRILVRGGAQYFTAPDVLERTVRAALRGSPFVIPKRNLPLISENGRPRRAAPTVRSEKPYPLRWLAAAAAVILALTGVLLWTILSTRSRSTDLLTQEIVSSHIRSMMLDHLVDVPSSDQHTVKPWFNGKLDFAPDVKDFAAEGFPLTGGRLDYIDNRPVAALVYQRGKHAINLFIWSSPGLNDQPAEHLSRTGYNIIHWTKSGATYWAISDVNNADLTEFVQLVSQ